MGSIKGLSKLKHIRVISILFFKQKLLPTEEEEDNSFFDSGFELNQGMSRFKGTYIEAIETPNHRPIREAQ